MPMLGCYECSGAGQGKNGGSGADKRGNDLPSLESRMSDLVRLEGSTVFLRRCVLYQETI